MARFAGTRVQEAEEEKPIRGGRFGGTRVTPSAPSPEEEQALLDSQLEELFGETVDPSPVAPPKPDPTFGDYAEAALSTGINSATGLVGNVAGSIEGLKQTLASGKYGTAEGAEDARETKDRFVKSLAHEPSPEARQVISDVSEVIEPLSYISDPLIGHIPALQGITVAGQAALRGGLQRATGRKPNNTSLPEIEVPDLKAEGLPKSRANSAGAVQSGQDVQRAASAADLPVPMTGDRAPTLGQLTRDQSVLRMEREMAKRDDFGDPLRERFDEQNRGLNENLQAMDEAIPSRNVEDRGIGQAVAQATEKRKAAQYKDVQAAYKKATEAGELEQPIALGNLDNIMLETDRMSSLAPNADPILKEARRLGVVDGDGASQAVPAKTLEDFRQFVVQATDPADKRESRFGNMWKGVIDEGIDATDVGPEYRNARRKFSRWKNEFEETPLVRDVLKTKRGTNERQMPYEEVFNKTIKSGSVDEVNKLRGTLLKGGEDGKEAWFDLKARLARGIGDNSLTSATDSSGNPIISPAKLKKQIAELDRTGKLEAIFGRKGAADWRNISETADTLLTTPPGTVNYSNTSSAILNAISRVPGVKTIANFADDVKTKKSINKSLTLSQRKDLKELLE